MQNADMRMMKEINLDTLRGILKRQRTATKPQLAELSGLSVVTINALVRELAENGEIIEGDVQHSATGRPAVSYRYNSEFHLALVICMQEKNGEDFAFVSVNNLYGSYLKNTEYRPDEVSEEFFDSIIVKYLEKYPAIHVIAFGIPGSEVNGRLLYSDYTQLKGQFFTGRFKQKYGLPVLLENDVNAATAGYCGKRAIAENQCVAGIFFPESYPPGAGIYLNGRIHRGRDGAAGELAALTNRTDWHNIAYQEVEKAAADFVLPITLLYNPHRIVFYGSRLENSLPDVIRQSLLGKVPPEILPEMDVVTDLRPDYQDGMAQMALATFERG